MILLFAYYYYVIKIAPHYCKTVSLIYAFSNVLSYDDQILFMQVSYMNTDDPMSLLLQEAEIMAMS